LYEFGLKLGLLFQIEDDIIDATMSTQDAGKPTCNDGNKNSFVNLLGLDGAQKKKEELLNELKNDVKNLDNELANRLQKIISEYFKG
jgi:farnesyl diphosphate synthase